MDKSTAIIITGGYLDTASQNAHGLIRGTDRFFGFGDLDEKNAAGAGEVLENQRDIRSFCQFLIL